jgi:predicted small lipoprotein YifL
VRYTSAMLPRPKFLLFASAFVALLASSCGLKGPLYRADEPTNETVAPVGDPTDVGKKKPGESSVQPPATDPDRPAVPPGP